PAYGWRGELSEPRILSLVLWRAAVPSRKTCNGCLLDSENEVILPWNLSNHPGHRAPFARIKTSTCSRVYGGRAKLRVGHLLRRTNRWNRRLEVDVCVIY